MTKIATTPNDMTTQVGYLKELQNYLVHLRLEVDDEMFAHVNFPIEPSLIAGAVWRYLTVQINNLQNDINDLS